MVLIILSSVPVVGYITICLTNVRILFFNFNGRQNIVEFALFSISRPKSQIINVKLSQII